MQQPRDRLGSASWRRGGAVALLGGLGLFATLATMLAAPARGADTKTVCPSGCDFSSVVTAVGAASQGDVIEVAAGRYEGEVHIDKGLTIQGVGAQEGGPVTELVGLGDGSVVYVDMGQRVELRGLRISGGNGMSFDDIRYGGGIYLEGEADVLLEDLVISGNEGAWEGGGVYLNDGELEMRNVHVTGNRVFEAGAGLYINTAGILTMSDSEVRGNVARNPEGSEEFSFANGGGMAVRGRAVAERVVIEDNEAEAFGGGLYIFAQGDFEMRESRIAGNEAGREGGGIWSSIEVDFDGLELIGNVSGQDGGGLYNIGTARIANASISDNRAVNGGGIHNQKGFAAQQLGELTMSFVTMADNQATGVGGAMVVRDEGRSACELCTLSGNSAPKASMVQENGAARVEFTHSTLYSQTGTALQTAGSRIFRLGYSLVISEGDAEAVNCTGTFASLGHNLDSDGTCGLDRQGDLVRGDTGIEPLADNGGPLRTHGLASDSPAIDTGHPNRCPATDQRGFPSPIDGDGDGTAQCDIGAFEYGSEEPGDETPTPTSPPPTAVTPSATPEPGETPATPTATPTGGDEPASRIYLPSAKND